MTSRIRQTANPKKVDLAATSLQVPVGQKVLELLDLAYRARRPLLLEGPTGIGKSQIVSEFTRTSGLELVILDLSLLEPPDLVGLPVIKDGRTHYASPAELPQSGRGILLLEELNRAEIPVMQPALQLLSARRLHSYELPEGWTCIASINPEDGDYQVNRLDPALRSRFLQLSVCAERQAWLNWAGKANVHPLILNIVRDHTDAFEHAPPRSWSYASEILHALRPEEASNIDLVRVALRGYLPSSWSMLAANALSEYPELPTIEADQLLGDHGHTMLAKLVREFEEGKRVDAIAMLAAKLRQVFSTSEKLRLLAESGTITMDWLEQLLAPLPGDMRDQCLDSIAESPAAEALFLAAGNVVSDLIVSYRGSSHQSDLQGWRKNLQLHRVRLTVVSVQRWLEVTVGKGSLPNGALEELAQLVTDAGPLGLDLARWIRVHSQECIQDKAR